MKRFFRFTLIASLTALLIIGCGRGATTQSTSSSPVATSTIVASPATG
jgi:ABC-type glycerol-3-phosphate transport system substrate-binding protein